MAVRAHSFRSVAVIAALAMTLVAAPRLSAQQPTDDKVKQLEQKLDELLRQAGEIRKQLDELKGEAPSDDLANVDVIQTPPAPATPAPAPAPAAVTEPELEPAPADIQTVDNAPDPSASKVFNPDISVIGNFVGHAGDTNPFESGPDSLRAPASFEEAELALEAFIDPYAKGRFFLAFTPEEVELEEGYAQFLTLGHDLTAKAGKVKAQFGKANTWHTHARPWVDQPLLIHNFFGDEGLRDAGISVSKLFPNSFAFTEATVEVLSGDVEDVFGRTNQNDLFYNTHLKAFKDITENGNLEVGASYARGTLPESGGRNQFAGVDVSYRWRPLQQGLYRGFIGRIEAVLNDREDVDRRLFGVYATGEYKFSRRWIAGLRLDRADRGFALDDESGDRFTDRGLSAVLTFWPSEFSQLRGQLRRTSYGGLRTVNEILLQLQFSIGAHGAHAF
jgi:hypothetical protein